MSAEIICEKVSLGYETGIVAEGLDFTVAAAIISVFSARTVPEKARW